MGYSIKRLQYFILQIDSNALLRVLNCFQKSKTAGLIVKSQKQQDFLNLDINPPWKAKNIKTSIKQTNKRMNTLIQTLSGLRVLCGETIMNCLPIHKIFVNSNDPQEQEEEEEEQKHSTENDGYQQRNMNINSFSNINSKQMTCNSEETARLNLNHYENQHIDEFSTMASHPSETSSLTFDSMIAESTVEKTQKQPEKTIQAQPASQQQSQPQRKQMLGMIEEDKIKQIEKKSEDDDVDYFSDMGLGATQPSFKVPVKITNTPATKLEKQEPPKENKFINAQTEEEDLEGTGWGDVADDIEL